MCTPAPAAVVTQLPAIDPMTSQPPARGAATHSRPLPRRALAARTSFFAAAGVLVLGAAGCAEPTRSGSDPERLLFLSSRDGGLNEFSQPIVDIYRMNSDGSAVENLTEDPDRHYGGMSPSPDGRKVVFFSTRSTGANIWVMNTDGSGLTQLTNRDGGHADGSNAGPRWSPDGTRIAFVTNREGRSLGSSTGVYDVYVMNADGSNPHNVGSQLGAGLGSNPEVVGWTPNGRVVFRTSDVVNQVSQRRVYVVNADGTGLQPLMPMNDYSPAWSPDGSRVVFIREQGERTRLFIMNADGSGVRALTDHVVRDILPGVDGGTSTGFEYSPWSPDGGRIAFEAGSKLFVINPDGSGLHQVTPSWGTFNGWSPDGGRIAFTKGEATGQGRDVFVVNADGTGLVNLTNHPAEDINAVWLRR